MYNDLKITLDVLRLPFSWLCLAVSFAGTVLLFVGLAKLCAFIIADGSFFAATWLNMVLGYVGGFFVLVLGWLMFPLVMTAIACLFLDGLADRLERLYYPDLPKGKPSDWGDGLAASIRLLGRTVMLNLFALPFYFIPVVNLVAYAMVNSHLLGREYFFNLALRHLSLEKAGAVYVKERLALHKTGLKLAVFFMIPGLNLLAPLLATGLMLRQLEHYPTGAVRQALALGAPGVLTESP